MSLRSDENENADNFDEMVSENSAVLDLQQEVTDEMSISELAKMMKDKFKEFSENFKVQSEKTNSLTETLNVGLSNLEETMSRYETKHNQVDEKLAILSNSVDSVNQNHAVLDATVKEVMTKIAQLDEMQKELLEKQRQVIRLSEELEERMAIIDSTNGRIEYLENWKQSRHVKDEVNEQRGRKMNVWIYGVEENSKENLFEVITNFCTNTLKLNPDIPENWLFKNPHRVGDHNKPRRPIIIAFVLWEDRQALLKAAAGLYKYNQENNTRFSVKTDLAPKARQERADLYGVAAVMREKEQLHVRVCDNAKGKVWIERKAPSATRWLKVHAVNPTYHEIAKARKKVRAQQQQSVASSQPQQNQSQARQPQQSSPQIPSQQSQPQPSPPQPNQVAPEQPEPNEELNYLNQANQENLDQGQVNQGQEE